MSLYHGLFVRATAVPDLNVNISEGLMEFGDAMVFVAETPLAVTAAGGGLAKLAIVQINSSGTCSIKYSSSVAVASQSTLEHPAPDSGQRLLAKLFTAAAPILNATTAIANANINNKVKDAVYGGR